MKKGVLTYDFNRILWLRENNIGDYVQSLAALQIVGEDWKELIYIERENLKKQPKNLNNSKVKVIMNGWYLHKQNSMPLNENILPLFTSVHLGRGYKLDSKAKKTFKKFEPIGCRDIQSMERFEKEGIKAYFSGCLTLTFDKRENERKGILFVVDNIKGVDSLDKFLKWKGSDEVLKELRKQFTQSEIESAEFRKQTNSKKLGHHKQFEIAEEWLETLASKEIVVTTRIHSLMPSMSLGTPTLFIMRNNLDKRFKGLKDFWNYIDFTNYKTSSVIEKKILKSDEGKIINNETFREFMKEEKNKIINWWNEN